MADFELLPECAQDPIDAAPFHEWAFPDGPTFIVFYRTPSGYLLRFPENADFLVTSDLAVTCAPAPDVPFSSCEHLYLNQVLPLVLAQQGKLVLHGSAVVVDGKALGFMARAGSGKSTMAAAFAVDGCPFLTDDGLLLEPEGAGYLAMPSHPSIRLWDDSHAALLPPDASTAPAVHYTSKSRFVAGAALEYCDRAAPMGTAYLLGPGDAADVELRRLEPGQAVHALLQHSFILDIEDRPRLAANFDQLARLANAVACFHLDYPRCYEDLPRVMRAIKAHAASQDCRS